LNEKEVTVMGKGSKYIPPVIAGILLLLALMILPIPLFLFAAILIIVAFVLADAAKNRLLLVIAVRNIVRKRSTTALAICGLMVGTAIFSASFAVSDTMDNMIVQEVSKGYGEIDFTLRSMNQTGFRYYNESDLAPIIKDLSGIRHVEASDPIIAETIGARSIRNGLFSSSVGLYGVTPFAVSHFGGLFGQDGKPVGEMPPNGSAYVHESTAKSLDIKADDVLMIGYGSRTAQVRIVQVVKNDGLATYGTIGGLYVNLGYAQNLTGRVGQTNIVLISIEGPKSVNIGYAKDVRSGITQTLGKYKSLGFMIYDDKEDFLQKTRSAMSIFTDLFFVFGTFSIISGVILIVNVFTMLGEERKSEFGVIRAIGLKRKAMRRIFTYEGLVYGCAAAGVGAVVGLGLAYLIILFLGMIGITGGSPLQDSFIATPASLMIAYMTGLLLTLLTVFIATVRISNLNIVRAVRNIPEPEIQRSDSRVFRMGAGIFACGMLLMLMGIAAKSYTFDFTGLSISLLSLGMLLRRSLGDRIAWSLAGIATLVIWIPGLNVFGFVSGSSGIEMFVISGVFMVTSLLVIVMYNSDSIVHFFTAALMAKGRYRAVVKTSMSYPLKAKFRTALSIFIFGLVIYTIVSLSVMTGLMSQTTTKVVKETSGDRKSVV
jgi:putative ABC transport system permease protein